jgi:Arabinose-binding domain of AraC transcription regulator, N-term
MHAPAHNAVTLLHVPPYLTKHGVHPLEVLTQAGVAPSALLDPNGWMPRELCFRLGADVVRVTGDRFAGAHITDAFRLEELRAWGTTVAAAPDLRQACLFAANRIGILQQGTELVLLTSRHQSQLRFRFIGELGADPLQPILGSLGVLRKVALLADAPDAVSVRLSMPYSRGVDQLEQVFGPALQFGCEHDAIVIDREIMNSPIVASDNATDGGFETALEAGRLLKELLPFEQPTIEKVAARQQMAVRTLQRRLKDWASRLRSY